MSSYQYADHRKKSRQSNKPMPDDIKVEYHPHSKIPSTIHRFVDFSRHHSMEDSVPRSTSPWEPFRTRLDFEVAEIALEAAMTKDQTNRLFNLLHRSACGKEAFTLQSHDEVRSFWEMASEQFTPFQSSVVSVKYRSEVHDFNMYSQPLWDWALDLLRDSRFAKHFPWTANTFWDAQSRLPPDAKPLAFILYADKNKLSSFGTQKGYPIIARIANLPVEIWNGVGVAGGRVVGWLPIVNENQKDSGKASFVNFKNVVWHESFLQLIESVIQHSKTGYWFDCGDLIRRLLWPIILILSADYEEQCIMSLICGLKGKFPCPVCLVPQDMQSIYTEELTLRISAESQQVLKTARLAKMKKARENHLKAFSLHNVENVFWKVHHCDIHRALSWDCMHANNGRLWSDHLWVELQFWITDLGREAAVQIDSNFDAFPRWPDLQHFSHVMKIDFTDSATHEDISKLVVFAVQNILTRTESKLGYLLLRCICRFVMFDMYAALEVHTEDTIAAGRETLCEFLTLLDEYITKSEPETGKNWNFPKKHSNVHVFDDILAKGATRNYNTKPNERMHGPLRIIRYDHWLLTSTSMCSEIDDLDEYTRQQVVDPEAGEEIEEVATHTYLGVRRGSQSFSQIEQEHAADTAFSGFRIRLNRFLNEFLPQFEIPFPDGRRVHFRPDDQVTVFQYLWVNYESMVDWHLKRDLLRCNPSFFGSPRYDCVMVKAQDQPLFAHLIFLFRCSIGEIVLSFALIHPYDVAIGHRHRQDIDLGLYHVRAKPCASLELISIESIIRGAVLASDPATAGDYFIVDTIDTDIFL
ncbi:uncharacterized protein F5891DRAFT_1125792 [Suillus fuscotomentosus]|uniref:Uncharacterized protein n=1 Tax=Suillus fuscotomentosus TaxID=1912939 RepID=A0AAD4EGQ6_9AGAM|nr:uncharacterized protein F5891DRAFT_1125792 [Suillus fuscotomentosus]KAG1905761.1 hypothetical protein F5891DRAFT_1125792 [Suillus fuscotomentosus]